jgi:hypothetical protein
MVDMGLFISIGGKIVGIYHPMRRIQQLGALENHLDHVLVAMHLSRLLGVRR